MKSEASITDCALLTRALSTDLPPTVREAFTDMLDTLQGGKHRTLSARQRTWVEKEIDAHVPSYVNAYSSGKIARGKEVEINCGPLVKQPPGRTG